MAAQVSVLLFALLGEVAGCRRLEVAMAPGMTVRDVAAELAARFPGLRPLLGSAVWAVNEEYAGAEHVLAPGDEVAVIPPVSGGSGDGGESDRAPAMYEVVQEPIPVDAVLSRVAHRDAGAIVLFLGTVREHTAGRRTVTMDYDAYSPMAEKEMSRIGRDVAERWPNVRLAITHRVGRLHIGEVSVAIAASAPHRPEAFLASRYAIDRLKVIVPVWKKEWYEDGTAEWVRCDHEQDPVHPSDAGATRQGACAP